MFNFESFNLSFSFSAFLFFAGLLVIAAYAWYVYRYTVPVVSPSKKITLTLLRTAALLILLFIIFEPIVTIAKKNILEPLNLVFIDDSRSITIKDGTNRQEHVKNFIKEAGDKGLPGNTEYFTFGNDLNNLKSDSLSKISFNGGSTNFSNIFSMLEKDKREISSVVIISDGVITDGPSPIYTAEKLHIPVYTIGVGDTARRNDIEIKNVLYNEYLYAETPTTINAAVSSAGFNGKTIQVTLFENDVPAGQTNLVLSDGTQSINFEYTPKTSGEKKLSIVASAEQGEFTSANNRRTFYVNVLSNKIKALIVAGSPSSDLTFVKNSLKSDPNLSVNSITQIGPGKFLEAGNQARLIDSADIFYLVGFPSKDTPDELLNRVTGAINSRNKPFLILLADGIDINKLSKLQMELPFSVGRYNPGYSEVQPIVTADKSENPLLQNNAANPLNAWNNLPPVLQTNTVLEAKPESEVLARIKINNVPINKPLVVSRRLGNKRSIAVLAKDIWRWKLQTSLNELNLYDNFMLQSVKWLNTTDEQKQVRIKTSKRLYSSGETVEFSGQVYDQAGNPVSDAEVKVGITPPAGNRYDIVLNSIGNGLYEGTYQPNKPGDYSFSGTAVQNNSTLGKDGGRFNVGEIDIEMVNPRMDYEFLNLLSNQTGGKYFNAQDYSRLFDLLEQRANRDKKEKISVSEINLWSNEWLMAIAVLLFAAEWFLRKRSGML